MTRLIISRILIPFVFLTSCNTQAGVRENALKFKCHSDLNGIVEYYSRCHYKMPEKVEDIAGFLERWKSQDSSTYVSEYDNTLDYLYSGRLEMESYEDSVFLFDSENEFGCCVYGTPQYWLSHSESYPSERLDFSEMFNTAALDENGKYIFNGESELIDELILKTAGKFKQMEMTTMNVHSWVNDEIKAVRVSKGAIFAYDTESKVLNVLAETPSKDSVFLVDNNSFAGMEESTDGPSTDYITEIKDSLDCYLRTRPGIGKVIFFSPFYH